jgi:diacylglycerol kinase (ATP)
MNDAQVPGDFGGFKNALVIYNPTAGRRRLRRLEAVLDGLSGLGCAHHLLRTLRRGDAEDAARCAAANGFDLILVAGGDGTVNEAANGLANAVARVPLAVVPLGTANVLAAEIGLAPSPKAVQAMLAGGRRRNIRLGQIDGRYFVLMASVGVDAAVVLGVNLAFKRHAGKLAYAVEALRQGLAYDFPAFRATIDGIPHSARMVVACRARCYGGPFQVAPNADLGDDKLHVVLLQQGGLLALLRYGLALATGRLSRLPDVQVIAGKAITIQGPRGSPVQTDGDLVGMLPSILGVSDRVIELVVP